MKAGRGVPASARSIAAALGLQEETLIVQLAVLPAAIEDANPSKGQRAHGGMVRDFLILPPMAVIGLGPLGKADGLAGKLMEGLAQEFGTGVPHHDHGGVAAAFVDGSNAAETLQGGGAGPGVAIGTERGDEAGDGGRSRP